MLLALFGCAATGAVAGLLAGLLGVGGGMIIVPALVFLLPGFGVSPAVLTQVAVGSSLASISVISINSARAHHVRGGVYWPFFLRLAPGLVVGAWVGAAVADHLSSLMLQRVVGVGALLLAIKMFAGLTPAGERRRPGAPALAGVGGLIGSASALIGIGGGSLTVPFLAWCGLTMPRAVGTSSACGIPIAWAGVLGYIIAGWGQAGHGAYALGYVQVPAVAAVVAGSLLFTPMGAALAHRLPAAVLRRIFAGLLLLVGLRMLFG